MIIQTSSCINYHKLTNIESLYLCSRNLNCFMIYMYPENPEGRDPSNYLVSAVDMEHGMCLTQNQESNPQPVSNRWISITVSPISHLCRLCAVMAGSNKIWTPYFWVLAEGLIYEQKSNMNCIHVPVKHLAWMANHMKMVGWMKLWSYFGRFWVVLSLYSLYGIDMDGFVRLTAMQISLALWILSMFLDNLHIGPRQEHLFVNFQVDTQYYCTSEVHKWH